MQFIKLILIVFSILLFSGCCNIARTVCAECEFEAPVDYIQKIYAVGNPSGGSLSSVVMRAGEDMAVVDYYYQGHRLRGMKLTTSFGDKYKFGEVPTILNGGWEYKTSRGPYKEVTFFYNPSGDIGYRITGHKIKNSRNENFQWVENGSNPTSYNVPKGAILKEIHIRSGSDIDEIKYIYDIPDLN